MKLSAVIITLNEEHHIGRCLASLEGVADEVVVLDAGSTDRTGEMCRSMGARFHTHPWDGYSNQRNRATALASHDWVLTLDADEALSGELRDSILAAKAAGGHRNFCFPRLTDYCGRPVRHTGWYPDLKFRLFDRRECRWEGWVHERPTQPASGIRRLRGDLLHRGHPTISSHVLRIDRYSTLGAEELMQRGRRPSVPRIVLSPMFKFFKLFVLQRGFLDGMTGLTIATVSAYGTFLKYAKHHRLWAESRQG